MSEFYDKLETRDPAERERNLISRLPALIAAALKAPGWAKHLADVDPKTVTSRAALARRCASRDRPRTFASVVPTS